MNTDEYIESLLVLHVHLDGSTSSVENEGYLPKAGGCRRTECCSRQ